MISRYFLLPPMHAATRVLITARPITSPSPGASMEACSMQNQIS